MNILSLDIGTTSMRGILYNEACAQLCTHSVQSALHIENGRIEQNPQTFLDGATAICKAIAQAHPVDAISVTAFRSAITLVNRAGEALCDFVMWQDTRNGEICRRLKPLEPEVYAACGASINTVFTATKMTWLSENEPSLYQSAYKVMIVPDYVIHFMTGAFTTDYTYGSRSLLMDIRTLTWSDRMCQLFGVERDKLCDLIPQGSVAGRVNKAFASLTGLREGIPVVTAGGDQQCGALGLGVMDSSTIEVNSGTGSFVISLTDKPFLDNPSIICNVAAVPGMYTLEMNVISSASAVNWLIREYFPELGGECPDFQRVNAIAEATPPGANGLVAVPHFQGCGSRDWNPEARAGFWGFTLGSRRNDMIRALYEGIAAEIAKSIDVLPQSARKAKAIAVAGGLSKADVYAQILSDMTGRVIQRCRNAQATAVGAFVSAAVTLGLYPDHASALQTVNPGDRCAVFLPNEALSALYRQNRQRAERLYRAGSEGETQ